MPDGAWQRRTRHSQDRSRLARPEFSPEHSPGPVTATCEPRSLMRLFGWRLPRCVCSGAARRPGRCSRCSLVWTSQPRPNCGPISRKPSDNLRRLTVSSLPVRSSSALDLPSALVLAFGFAKSADQKHSAPVSCRRQCPEHGSSALDFRRRSNRQRRRVSGAAERLIGRRECVVGRSGVARVAVSVVEWACDHVE